MTDESQHSETPHQAGDHDTASHNNLANNLRHAWRWYLARKIWTIPATVVAFLVLDLVLPVGGYPVLGLVLKGNATFTVLDSTTNRPVSGVSVDFWGKSAKTDANGHATVQLPIGRLSV